MLICPVTNNAMLVPEPSVVTILTSTSSEVLKEDSQWVLWFACEIRLNALNSHWRQSVSSHVSCGGTGTHRKAGSGPFLRPYSLQVAKAGFELRPFYSRGQTFALHAMFALSQSFIRLTNICWASAVCQPSVIEWEDGQGLWLSRSLYYTGRTWELNT